MSKKIIKKIKREDIIAVLTEMDKVLCGRMHSTNKIFSVWASNKALIKLLQDN